MKKSKKERRKKKNEFKPLALIWDKEYQVFQEAEVKKIKESYGKKVYHFEDYCDFLENFIYNLPVRKKTKSITKPFTLYPEKNETNGEK